MPVGVYIRSEEQKATQTARLPHHRVDPLARFWSKVSIQDNGCWLWLGYLNNKGYGKLSVNLQPVYAHRFAFEQFRGPIPPDKEIDHTCRNHACVNPRHMDIVTTKENGDRGRVARWTGYCIRGHPWDADNTYINPNTGHSMCRTCHREKEYQRKYGKEPTV